MKINHILLLGLLVVISSVMGTAIEPSRFTHRNLARHDRLVDAAHHVFVRAENPFYRRAYLHRGVYAAPSVYGGLRPISTRVHATPLVYAPARPYARRSYPVTLTRLAVRAHPRPFYNPSLNFRSVRPGFTRRVYAPARFHTAMRPDLTRRVYAAPLGNSELNRRPMFPRANINPLFPSQPLTTVVRRPFLLHAH